MKFRSQGCSPARIAMRAPPPPPPPPPKSCSDTEGPDTRRGAEKKWHRDGRAPFCGHLIVPSGAGAAGRQHTGPGAGRPSRGGDPDAKAAIAGGGGRRERRRAPPGPRPGAGPKKSESDYIYRIARPR